MPSTPELIAQLSTAPELPPDAIERKLVDDIHSVAPHVLPDLTERQLGEALMQTCSLLGGLLDRIRDAGPMLDWESRITIAMNVTGVAGMELFEAAGEATA